MGYDGITEQNKSEKPYEGYEKSDQTFLRWYNHQKILNILRTAGPMSRIDLAKTSRLDKKTITNIVADMLAQGTVYVSSIQKPGNGRPKEILALSGDFYYCIGIDIGGTHVTAVLIDFAAKVLASKTIDLHSHVPPDTILNLCDLLVEFVLENSGLTMEKISSIGVTFPGVVDHKTGKSILAENLPDWNNVPVQKIFEDKYGKVVAVEDCSRTMALAELWLGDNNCENFIVFDLGLGIGCGIVINNNLFTGSNGKSGEIGHMIVEVNGPLCTCGRRGCIESLSSGWALSQQTQNLLNQGKCNILQNLISKSENTPNMKEVILAAGLGDESCQELLAKAGEYIGIGIANALSLFNPAKVILGGRLIKDNRFMLESIVETVRQQTIADIYRDAQIELSGIGDNASAIGAAILCLQQCYAS